MFFGSITIDLYVFFFILLPKTHTSAQGNDFILPICFELLPELTQVFEKK
jgi:hypothetical protein